METQTLNSSEIESQRRQVQSISTRCIQYQNINREWNPHIKSFRTISRYTKILNRNDLSFQLWPDATQFNNILQLSLSNFQPYSHYILTFYSMLKQFRPAKHQRRRRLISKSKVLCLYISDTSYTTLNQKTRSGSFFYPYLQ